MWLGLVICAVALVALFLAEARGRPPIAAAAKLVASAGFLVAALLEGAAASLEGQALLIALVWSALGDALLIPRDSRPAFILGMLAFAIAHLGYAFLFHLRGVDALGVGVGAAVAGVAGAAFFVWLRPHIRRRAPGMAGPVLGYVVVITIMVAMAAGAVVRAPDAQWLGLVAALVFWLSDITVAVLRFADGRRAWRLVGLPLYYGAQFLFVATLR